MHFISKAELLQNPRTFVPQGCLTSNKTNNLKEPIMRRKLSHKPHQKAHDFIEDSPWIQFNVLKYYLEQHGINEHFNHLGNWWHKIKALFAKHYSDKAEADYQGIDFPNEYRAIDDGSHDNFIRIAQADYADGYDVPSGGTRPSARDVSNTIFSQEESIPDPTGTSDAMWLWGQFIDHDIDLTKGAIDPESFNIVVPTGDIHFDPDGNGSEVIPLTRSGYDSNTGGEYETPREQVNEITPFIDASMIYGSDQERNDFIRTDGGKLKTSEGDLLPYNTAMLANAGGPDPSLFLAGDVRANENVALTSMHTLFVREHNYIVDQLKLSHPELSDEELYQKSKLIVEAEIQAITYNDFLPLLLGEDALSQYTGYDASVNPQIANFFATAAYRLGHTMLSNTISRINEDGSEDANGHLALRDAFFRPSELNGGIDGILRGVAEGHAERIDTSIIDEVRNFLFGEPGDGGFDLAALNIQRGRDHGLPDYNAMREAYGLQPLSDFDQITSDRVLAEKLESVYGDINDIDAFVGGLAEDTYGDSMLGELFYTAVADQFTRLRDGDAYYYASRLSPELIEIINDTHLSDIIMRNTDVDYLQENVFLAYNRLGGDNKNNHIEGGEGRDLIIGFGGKDKLKGHQGDDELYGGNGNDKLFGNDGNDKLVGGKGNDYLSGGEGDDVYVFSPHSGHDKIAAFQENDLIDLTDYNTDFAALTIRQKGDNTLIKIDDASSDSIHLIDVMSATITEDDFVF